MQRDKTIRFLAASALIIVIVAGAKWVRGKVIRRRIFSALRADYADWTERTLAIAQWRDSCPTQTTTAIIDALNDKEGKVRNTAARFLPALIRKSPNIVDALVDHLLHNEDRVVRLGSIIALMQADTSTVQDALAQALNDSDNQIVEIACTELRFRNPYNPTVTAGLYGLLNHCSWNVRLAACRALVELKVADMRVVTTLETMSHEPEATIYDAEMEKLERAEKEIQNELNGPLLDKGSYDRFCTILAQAKSVASVTA